MRLEGFGQRLHRIGPARVGGLRCEWSPGAGQGNLVVHCKLRRMNKKNTVDRAAEGA
jgi:hypothetical protein